MEVKINKEIREYTEAVHFFCPGMPGGCWVLFYSWSISGK